MSLATRCTACGTIFRVVEDQLRVSEGWVRCGRCAEVFDAREQLFDIEREAPPPWPAAPSPELTVEAPTSSRPAAAPAPDETTWVVPREETVHVDERSQAEPSDVEIDIDLPPPTPVEPPASGFHDSRREPYFGEPSHFGAPASEVEPELEPPHEPAAAPAPVFAEPARDEVPLAAPDADETSAAAAAPQASFLRDAESASRWKRPKVRAALALAATALALLAAVQATWQFRDALLALFPQSEPVLRAFCSAAGCELQPWRRIDALTVDSSSLSVAGNGNNYKLKVSLRNKAGYVVALPWVDLTLTDGNGAVVSRRMLKPADFDTKADRISGHAELTLQLMFSTGTQRVSGYTIEIFHP
jgi:predicted Zn finger-like uncharacterized protein